MPPRPPVIRGRIRPESPLLAPAPPRHRRHRQERGPLPAGMDRLPPGARGDRFFIADNGSTDGSGALLAALDAAGIVRPPALPRPARGAGRSCRPTGRSSRRHGAAADWIAFIDADEFLLPAARPFPGALPRLLARLGADPGVGAVAVNWALYGSSGQLAAGPGPVIERFARRRRARRSCPTTTSSRSCAPRPAPRSAATRTPSASPRRSARCTATAATSRRTPSASTA